MFASNRLHGPVPPSLGDLSNNPAPSTNSNDPSSNNDITTVYMPAPNQPQQRSGCEKGCCEDHSKPQPTHHHSHSHADNGHAHSHHSHIEGSSPPPPAPFQDVEGLQPAASNPNQPPAAPAAVTGPDGKKVRARALGGWARWHS